MNDMKEVMKNPEVFSEKLVTRGYKLLIEELAFMYKEEKRLKLEIEEYRRKENEHSRIVAQSISGIKKEIKSVEEYLKSETDPHNKEIIEDRNNSKKFWKEYWERKNSQKIIYDDSLI